MTGLWNPSQPYHRRPGSKRAQPLVLPPKPEPPVEIQMVINVTEPAIPTRKRRKAPWIIAAVVVLLLAGGGTVWLLRDKNSSPSTQHVALNTAVTVEQDAGNGATQRPVAKVTVSQFRRMWVVGGNVYAPQNDSGTRTDTFWIGIVKVTGDQGPWVAHLTDWSLIDSVGYSHSPSIIDILQYQLTTSQPVNPGSTLDFRVPFQAPLGPCTLQLSSGGVVYQWPSE